MGEFSNDRITIRNRDNGELSHGIRGHVPAGWEEVHDERAVQAAKASQALAAKGMEPKAAKPGNVARAVNRLQAVRSRKAAETRKRPE